MVEKKNVHQISPYLYEIPRSYREDMRVPARIYADRELLGQIIHDQSLEQLVNTATLPGIVKYALAMPDIHQGYGFSIGGVVATDPKEGGVVSPGGVGYDINCGIRLLASDLEEGEVRPHLSDLATALYQRVPSGVGESGFLRLSNDDMDDVLRNGARWALKQGMARADDLVHTEESGSMPGADPSKVSQRAMQRGRTQIGTLGAGNHFAELDVVDEIYFDEAARAMGLYEGQVVVQIHCGSRGFGHQVCTDYVQSFQRVLQKYSIVLPDRQLVCAPVDSPEGQDYLGAMIAAANYAWCNRQVLAHQIRLAFEDVLAGRVADWDLRQVYDIAHNMAKLEVHDIDGRQLRVCVHRKGATRAFGPGNPVLPDDYREIGQPVLVPGSMGTASWVLVGTEGSMSQTFGSTCHGAGRTMSRSRAKKEVRGSDLKERLEQRGIAVRAGSMKGLAEEAPVAYKDVDNVVNVVDGAGIARKVARLRPIAVVKG
ncbi:MAG: RtcB family protein [Caldilineales bacterium]